MASTFETVATELKEILDTEFASEQYVAIFDNLHESLGTDGVRIGIAPAEDVVKENDNLVEETFLEVRFYDFWVKEIDPETVVDPTRITGYAERFKHAIRVHNRFRVGSGDTWYFDLRRVTYPNDPTGNKSRFHATLRAHGNNSALIETSG